MAIVVNGETFDTMGDACRRLGIARQTMLNYIKEGYFSEPPTKKQGRSKYVRYFTEAWYKESEAKMADPSSKPGDGE